MAKIKYNVEVTRKDEYEIEIDDSIWTPGEIQKWSEAFQDAKKPKHIVDHLAKSIMHKGRKEYMEGFGQVKQRNHLMDAYDFYKIKDVDEEDFADGLSVTIISYKKNYETEIMKLRTK